MAVLKRTEGIAVSGWEEIVKDAIAEYKEQSSLNKLVQCGCKKERLLWLLGCVAKAKPKKDSLIDSFGFRRREAKAVVQRMRLCAQEFERLDKDEALRGLAWNSLGLGFLEHAGEIPLWLRGCATVVEHVYSRGDLKSPALNSLNLALGRLISYVLWATSAPHDNQVSALVNAVRSTDGYTADRLKTFRRDNARFVSPQALPSFLR